MMKTFQVIHTTSQAAYCRDTKRAREESERQTRIDGALQKYYKSIFMSCIRSEQDGEKKTEGGFTFDLVKMQRNKNNSEESNQSPESNQTARENGSHDYECVWA